MILGYQPEEEFPSSSLPVSANREHWRLLVVAFAAI
jgi:hypothetical protein